jgi:hypothetical protein
MITVNKQVSRSNHMATVSSVDVNIPLQEIGELGTPQPQQTKEGWCETTKYGHVFVSPGGIAWAVQKNGNQLESFAVKLTKNDVVGKSAFEKRQDAIKKSVRRQHIRVSRTPRAILAPSVVTITDGKVMETSK